MKQLKFFVILAMCVSLLACAAKTKVLMDASLPPGEIMQGKIQKVFLELTEKAKKKLPSEKYFAPKTLHVVVANTLNRNQMISKEGKYNITTHFDNARRRFKTSYSRLNRIYYRGTNYTKPRITC